MFSKMFLFFWRFQPGCSYKLFSYEKKGVHLLNSTISNLIICRVSCYLSCMYLLEYKSSLMLLSCLILHLYFSKNCKEML